MRQVYFLLAVACFACSASAAPLAVPTLEQQTVASGTQASIIAPAQFFTGTVRIDPVWPANETINTSGALVTFEPGARSAWHTHPAGQYLQVISGSGLTQQWGGPVQTLRPGDVLWCPPGIKHWHGASAHVAMTHLAITGVADGKNVEWLEQVTDEQYDAR